MRTFEYKDKVYTLRYSIPRVERIEQITGESVMSALHKNSGLITLGALRTYFTTGLYCEDEGRYAAGKEAENIYNDLIGSDSYTDMIADVMEAMTNDTPFLFRES